jgi:hypothetical protein
MRLHVPSVWTTLTMLFCFSARLTTKAVDLIYAIQVTGIRIASTGLKSSEKITGITVLLYPVLLHLGAIIVLLSSTWIQQLQRARLNLLEMTIKMKEPKVLMGIQ